jgi:hypothetical protein
MARQKHDNKGSPQVTRFSADYVSTPPRIERGTEALGKYRRVVASIEREWQGETAQSMYVTMVQSTRDYAPRRRFWLGTFLALDVECTAFGFAHCARNWPDDYCMIVDGVAMPALEVEAMLTERCKAALKADGDFEAGS